MRKGTGGRLQGPEPPPSAPAGAESPTDGQLLDRFVHDRDEAAFTTLVRRHGPVVLAACRRVLRNPHDAEEVFQATFLVLVRKAGTLRRPELLSNWLYGVASRIALKTRARAARRQPLEPVPASVPAADGECDAEDLRSVLDQEMVGLPEKYRVPLVLCYLEGLTNEDAARRLGWPPGSMSYRLARGRELLRKRLTRRGVFVGLPFLVAGMPGTAPAAPVPEPLVASTTRAARQVPPTPAAGSARVGRSRWAAAALALLLLGGAAALAGGSLRPVRPPPGGGVTAVELTAPAPPCCATRCQDP